MNALQFSLVLLLSVLLLAPAPSLAEQAAAPLQIQAFGPAEAPLHVGVVCGLAEFDDMAEAVCERWRAELQRTQPRVLVTLITPARPRPHLLPWDWPALRGLCSQPPPPPAAQRRSAAALELEAALVEAAPDILIVLRVGMNAVVMPFESCDATALNAPELWLVALALTKQIDYSGNMGLPRVVAAPQYRVVRGSGSLGRPAANTGSLPDYMYHSVGVPVALTLYLYENPFALDSLEGGAAALDIGSDLFFSDTTQDAVVQSLDGVLRMLAYPSDELYVSLCTVAGVLLAE